MPDNGVKVINGRVKTLKKAFVILGIVLFVVIFKITNLGEYLTLSYIKESQLQFASIYANHEFLVLGIYMLIYILVTALSLPGATVLTLFGGALFGLTVGFIAVSFASTIGATLAAFVSRFLLREWVQGKFGDKLKMINEGVDEEGPFYLFTLRLIPVFPFFVINLAMGLTKMSLVTFFWVSQIGMVPGTLVYVNAGKELAKIESLSGILSPSLIIAFVLLGVIPLAIKKLLSFYKSRRIG